MNQSPACQRERGPRTAYEPATQGRPDGGRGGERGGGCERGKRGRGERERDGVLKGVSGGREGM